MSKEKKDKVVVEEVEEVVVVEESLDEGVDKAPKGKEVKVLTSNGYLVRTYSYEDNGKDYVKLAKGFVEKNVKKGYKLA
jgi:hypothetical protein